MDYLLQKVAYLNGLAEGLKIDDKKAEGKLLLEIIDTLDEMAEAIAYLDDQQELMEEDLEFLEDDLTELECMAFNLDDEDYLDYDGDEIDFFDLENDDFRNIPPGLFDLDIYEDDEEFETEEAQEEEDEE
ncbi:MAG: hypothetical protein Q4P29_00065 [Tissierellia bacterium]|nr:hypothetical protein [Tissierellia bacterium]